VSAIEFRRYSVTGKKKGRMEMHPVLIQYPMKNRGKDKYRKTRFMED